MRNLLAAILLGLGPGAGAIEVSWGGRSAGGGKTGVFSGSAVEGGVEVAAVTAGAAASSADDEKRWVSTIEDVSNLPRLLERFRGQVVLVDLWATWCPPCRQSTPWLIELQRQHGKHGLVILSFNAQEDKATVEEYAKKEGINYKLFTDSKKLSKKHFESFGMPDFRLLGPDGAEIHKMSGFNLEQAAAFEARIAHALGHSH